MSSGSVKRVSREDIQLVQNLIERCFQLYMNQKEVVDTLLDQAKIEPGFTELDPFSSSPQISSFLRGLMWLQLKALLLVISPNRRSKDDEQVRLRAERHGRLRGDGFSCVPKTTSFQPSKSFLQRQHQTLQILQAAQTLERDLDISFAEENDAKAAQFRDNLKLLMQGSLTSVRVTNAQFYEAFKIGDLTAMQAL